MSTPVQGLHHITALSNRPNPNIEFYAGVLGLRLVKISVNPDVPNAYQLFYGNETGRPGTVLSFYCFPQIIPTVPGIGLDHSIGLSVPPNSLGFWRKRLKKFGISPGKEQVRMDEPYLEFYSPEGLRLELVASEGDKRPPYTEGPVKDTQAIKGIHHMSLSMLATERMIEFLQDFMGYEQIHEEGYRFRFGVKGRSDNFVDLSSQPETFPSIVGPGGIHHFAFHVPSNSHLHSMRKQLTKARVNTSPILDRTYFHSFFLSVGEGMIIEIATAAPGFSVDEPLDNLGASLKLPKALAKDRKAIEKALPKLKFDLDKYT